MCKPTHLITKISNPGKSFPVRTVSPNFLLNSISDCMIWQFQNYQIDYFLITRADGTPEVDTPQKQKLKLFPLPGQLWQGVFCLVAMAQQTSQTITCCRMMQVAHHRKNPNNSPASNVDNSRTKPKRQLRRLSILELKVYLVILYLSCKPDTQEKPHWPEHISSIYTTEYTQFIPD